VPHWKSIQLGTAKPPVRHELFHQVDESIIVSRFKDVDHLMHNNVLKTFDWLFG
jgi:hypothetical protein